MSVTISVRILLLPLLAILVFSISACLRTRADLSATQKIQRVTEEQRKAQFDLRFQEVDNQVRHMRGRIEAVESVLRQRSEGEAQANKNKVERDQEIWARIKLLEQAVEQLKAQWNQTQKKSTSQPRPPKSILARAGEHFANQRWKQAALDFEKYRSKNPKGKHYVSATYKIGVCFEELGDTDNARLFYKEVINDHSKHRVAKKARYRLKNLK